MNGTRVSFKDGIDGTVMFRPVPNIENLEIIIETVHETLLLEKFSGLDTICYG